MYVILGSRLDQEAWGALGPLTTTLEYAKSG